MEQAADTTVRLEWLCKYWIVRERVTSATNQRGKAIILTIAIDEWGPCNGLD